MGGEHLLHPVLAGIQDKIDLKTHIGEGFGHQAGIICGIGELPSPLLVVGISDHQRIARRLGRIGLHCKNGKKPCNSKQE